MKLKHRNCIPEYFEYYCQRSSKLIHILASYTVSKFTRFCDTVYRLNLLMSLDRSDIKTKIIVIIKTENLNLTVWQDCNSSSVLQAMNLLVSVAYRECMMTMDTAARQSDKLPHLVHLLCSLQTSLLASFSQLLESAHSRDQAESLIIQCLYLCLSARLFAINSSAKSWLICFFG